MITDQLPRANKEKVIDILMSKHRHQYQQSKLKRNFSFSSLSSFTMDHNNSARERDSGVSSAVGSEEAKDSGKESDVIFDSDVIKKNDVVIDSEFIKNNDVTKMNDLNMQNNVKMANDDVVVDGRKKNSVMFETGDLAVDEIEMGAMRRPFLDDSSDDEKVRFRNLNNNSVEPSHNTPVYVILPCRDTPSAYRNQYNFHLAFIWEFQPVSSRWDDFLRVNRKR